MPYFSITENICPSCKHNNKLFSDHPPRTDKTYIYACHSCKGNINLTDINTGISIDSLPEEAIFIKPINSWDGNT